VGYFVKSSSPVGRHEVKARKSADLNARAPKPNKLPADTEMNWWVGLALVLPLLISYTAMEVLLPRFMLLAAFLFVYLMYHFGIRATKLQLWSPSRITWVLFAFSAAFLVAQLVDTLAAAINKQEGLYRTLRYTLIWGTTILFSITTFREEEMLLRLFKVLALVLLVQASIGILQFYGFAFTRVPPQANDKPFGLMANQTAFGSGLALLFPFCGYVAYAGGWGWKIVSGAALWLGVYSLIIATTRSAWLAVTACLLVSNLGVVLLRNHLGVSVVRGWFMGMGIFVAGTILAVILAVRIPNNEHINQALRDRAMSVVQLSEKNTTIGSGRWRFETWRLTWRMILDHPLGGVGPGNFRICIPRYGFYEKLNVPTARQVTVPDHAHNVYLENGAETGFPGLLVYLGIWGVLVLMTVNVIIRADRNERRMLGIASMGTMAVYATDSMFSFPNEFMFHGLLLALGIGALVGLHERSVAARSFELKTAMPAKILLLVLAGVLSLFCVYLGHVKGNFEDRMRRAMSYEKLKQYDMLLNEADAGLNPLVTLSPRGLPLEYYAGIAYAGLGQTNRALEALRRAQKLNPGHLSIPTEMGSVCLQFRRWDEAISSFQTALALAPGFEVALHNLALAYYNQGSFRQFAQTLTRFDYGKDETMLRLSGSALMKLGQYEEAAAALRKGVHEFPNSSEMLELLAYDEYAHLHDTTNAYEHFERLLALVPDHPKRSEYTNVVSYLARELGKTTRTKPEN
jgi:O-antigen ligase/Flp pilus assembly protein TadD